MRVTTRRITLAAAIGAGLCLAGPASAAVSFNETVTESDIGVGMGGFVSGTAVVRTDLFVFVGSDETVTAITPPQTVNGKTPTPISVNFSGDTVFEYSISAPAGKYFQVTLPEGTEAGFEFGILFTSDDAMGVTLTPNGSSSLKLDGVVQTLVSETSGVDPQGREVRVEGFQEGVYTESFTFQTLTISLDYAVDSGNQPLIVDDVTRTLTASPQMYVSFFAASGNFTEAPTIKVVPEPASLTLLAVGGVALLRRRRAVR